MQNEILNNMLTEKELSDISLGYQWNKDMSYEDFLNVNRTVTREEGFELYELINERYIEKAYEQSKD
jgi:hypothetical protein